MMLCLLLVSLAAFYLFFKIRFLTIFLFVWILFAALVIAKNSDVDDEIREKLKNDFKSLEDVTQKIDSLTKILIENREYLEFVVELKYRFVYKEMR